MSSQPHIDMAPGVVADMVSAASTLQGITPDALRTSRSAHAVLARWLVMGAMRAEGYSQTQIAAALGREHSTVSSSEKRLQQRAIWDDTIPRKLATVRAAAVSLGDTSETIGYSLELATAVIEEALTVERLGAALTAQARALASQARHLRALAQRMDLRDRTA